LSCKLAMTEPVPEFSQIDSHENCARDVFPPSPEPERMRAGIIMGDQDKCSRDARHTQTSETFLRETLSNSFSMIRGRHRQVINQAPAAIVPAEHRGHDRPVVFRHATKARIAQKVSAYLLF